ncbi:PRC-barrel domain-containing protein [Algoriphagus sp. AGSA1]|nr:PRC-barrel domain-containing protein [Algoriphagus sp. AGSA1]
MHIKNLKKNRKIALGLAISVWHSIGLLSTRDCNRLKSIYHEHSIISLISSSTARSCDIRAVSDESVGSIEDIMLDTETGEVAYVVLSVEEDFLNLGSWLLALPWQAFDFHGHQREKIIVNVDKEKLEDAPGF